MQGLFSSSMTLKYLRLVKNWVYLVGCAGFCFAGFGCAGFGCAGFAVLWSQQPTGLLKLQIVSNNKPAH